VEQPAVGHRLEERARQLPVFVSLVGGRTNLGDELPRCVEGRAAVGFQGSLGG